MPGNDAAQTIVPLIPKASAPLDEAQATQAVIALNQAYVAAAAELCRQHPHLATILLHLGPDHLARLSGTTPFDLVRLSAVPVALVQPHPCLTRLLGATSVDALLAAAQDAVIAHDDQVR
ncbi:MAG: hypothetical protein R3F54_30180 [Alphaproteobacteria bacterium]